MRVVQDKPDYYYLETRFSVMGRGPVMFAAVRQGKSYVSYHLMPLYMNSQLQNQMSEELERRKQGKACFNFTKPDKQLFAEIAELTRLGFDSFRKLSNNGVTDFCNLKYFQSCCRPNYPVRHRFGFDLQLPNYPIAKLPGHATPPVSQRGRNSRNRVHNGLRAVTSALQHPEVGAERPDSLPVLVGHHP
jgi:hypothetical protein